MRKYKKTYKQKRLKEYLVESGQDATQWNLPHVTSNHHPTDAHEESHEYIDRIVVQKPETALDSAARLVTLLVGWIP